MISAWMRKCKKWLDKVRETKTVSDRWPSGKDAVLSLPWPRVQPLVKELRSHKPHSEPKKKVWEKERLLFWLILAKQLQRDSATMGRLSLLSRTQEEWGGDTRSLSVSTGICSAASRDLRFWMEVNSILTSCTHRLMKGENENLSQQRYNSPKAQYTPPNTISSTQRKQIHKETRLHEWKPDW